MASQTTTILLISPQVRDQRFLELTLADYKQGVFDLHWETDIETATAYISSNPVDVVIFDIGLAHYQVAFGRIKDLRSDLPIIVLSGDDNLELARAAMHFGAQDYLVRGTDDSNTVPRSIHYAIERERVEEALRRAYDELELKVEERTQSLKQVNTQLQLEIEQHRRTAQELRIAHEFSRAILDTVDALIIVLDAAGKIVEVNRMFEFRTGYGNAELVGCSVDGITAATDGDDNQHDLFQQILGVTAAGQFENVLLAKDGVRYTLKWSSTALYDVHGAVEYVILTGMDITEQRHLESLDRRRLHQLAHASRVSTMGEMATEIAHELNQPLAAIASYSNSCLRLLEDPQTNAEDLRQALRSVEQQALRSGQIIKHIRSFTRKEPASLAAVNLSKLVRDIIDLIRVEARWHDVKLQLNLQDNLPMVRVDTILVEQVLLNLVRNAIDAMSGMPKSNRMLEITTEAMGKNITVIVDDTGPGIDENIDVFEAFFTTKPEGIGMGLAISQSIVVSFGGKIWYERNSRSGARFCFALPVAEE